MASLVPPRFLFRVAYPCKYVKGIPRKKGDELLDLPTSCRLDNFAALDGERNFADVRVAWNEHGLGVQLVVTGKEKPAQGDIAKPRHSDGVTVWIDTRSDRTSHRAGRHCHQFCFLAAGAGPDRDEPAALQIEIHRASQDAPLASSSAMPVRRSLIRGGYFVEGFLPAAVLNGFDPNEHSRLGFYYSVHDAEHGDQTLGVGGEFPISEDPSLWLSLDLVR